MNRAPLMPRRHGLTVRWLSFLLLLLTTELCGQIAAPAKANQADILDYIDKSWDSLQRSMSQCSSVVDPKVGVEARVLYVPRSAVVPPEVEKLNTECHVRIERLPEKITRLGQ